MIDQETDKNQNKILTIPNALSLFRLLLVPVFCWTYLGLDNDGWTVAILVISACTDIVDGWIARHFDMTSDLGKVLDPIADKLTQAAMLLCLLLTFPELISLFVLLAVKEISDGITGLLVMKQTGRVLGAAWHGKLSTVLLYVTLIVHVMWREIPYRTSLLLMGVCAVTLVLSMVLYAIRNVKAIREHSEESEDDE